MRPSGPAPAPAGGRLLGLGQQIPVKLFLARGQHVPIETGRPLTPALAQNLPLMLRRRRRPTRLSLPWPRPEGLTAVIDRIAPVPLLIVHGTVDWLVPPDHARTLFERAGEPKSLVMLEGAMHAEYMLPQDPEPVVKTLLDFFGARL